MIPGKRRNINVTRECSKRRFRSLKKFAAILFCLASIFHFTTNRLWKYVLHEPRTRENNDSVRCNVAVYWINLETSQNRRQEMERHLEELSERVDFRHIRISGVSEVDKELHTLDLPHWLKLSSDYRDYLHHTEGKYTKVELACLLSHISAIRMAYKNNESVVVISEDDMQFQDDFFLSFQQKLNLAPLDWETLQLLTINHRVISYLLKMDHTNFVKWYPDHWSTGAYVINRKGMESVIQAFDIFVGKVKNPKQLEQMPRVLVADEFIYVHTRSYTATFSHVQARPIESTINSKNGIDIEEVNRTYLSRRASSYRLVTHIPSSLLIVSSARVHTLSDARQILSRAQNNLIALKPRVTDIEHSLTFVVNSEQIASDIKRQLASVKDVVDGISIALLVRKERFNKFWFVRNALPFMKNFQKVLVMDSDVLLSGFPIQEFFESIRDSVIGGALRRGVEENLITNSLKRNRQWFSAFSRVDWTYALDPTIRQLSLPFIEMYFVFMDAQFAHWFFSQTLEESFFHENQDVLQPLLESEFGTDVLWCGAAKSWINFTRSHKSPCLLSLFHVEHLDDRSIPDQSIDKPHGSSSLAEAQLIERKPMIIYQQSFKSWYAFSQDFRDFLGGRSKFDDEFLITMSKYKYPPSESKVESNLSDARRS